MKLVVQPDKVVAGAGAGADDHGGDCGAEAGGDIHQRAVQGDAHTGQFGGFFIAADGVHPGAQGGFGQYQVHDKRQGEEDDRGYGKGADKAIRNQKERAVAGDPVVVAAGAEEGDSLEDGHRAQGGEHGIGFQPADQKAVEYACYESDSEAEDAGGYDAGAALEHGDHGHADQRHERADGKVEAAADHHPADADGHDPVDGGLAEHVYEVAGCEEAGVQDSHQHDEGDGEDDLGLAQQEAAEGIELAATAQIVRYEGACKGSEVHGWCVAVIRWMSATSPSPPNLCTGRAHGPDLNGEKLAVSCRGPLSTGGTVCNRVRDLCLFGESHAVGWPAVRSCTRHCAENVRNIRCLHSAEDTVNIVICQSGFGHWQWPGWGQTAGASAKGNQVEKGVFL